MTADQNHPNTDDIMRAKGYLSTKEVARLLGKTLADVRYLAHDGKLRYLRMGTGPKAPLYIEWASVREYVGPETAEVLWPTKKEN